MNSANDVSKLGPLQDVPASRTKAETINHLRVATARDRIVIGLFFLAPRCGKRIEVRGGASAFRARSVYFRIPCRESMRRSETAATEEASVLSASSVVNPPPQQAS